MLQKLWFTLAYYKHPVWDTGTSPPELLSFIENHTPGKALDLGCGTGTNAITLAKSGWQVTGVDYVTKAIRLAKQKAHSCGAKVEFFQDDVTNLKSISITYDLILDIGCFHGLSQRDRTKYITTINRLLAPNGTFLLYVFFKENVDDHKPGVTEADIIQFSLVFNQITRVEGVERDILRSAWFSFQKPV